VKHKPRHGTHISSGIHKEFPLRPQMLSASQHWTRYNQALKFDPCHAHIGHFSFETLPTVSKMLQIETSLFRNSEIPKPAEILKVGKKNIPRYEYIYIYYIIYIYIWTSTLDILKPIWTGSPRMHLWVDSSPLLGWESPGCFFSMGSSAQKLRKMAWNYIYNVY